jgi:hypothetical protein
VSIEELAAAPEGVFDKPACESASKPSVTEAAKRLFKSGLVSF